MLIAIINFIRNHVKGCTGILEPLTQLTQDNAQCAWCDEQQNAFKVIKERAAESVMLVYPRVDLPSHLHLDSSDYQIGCAFSQLGLHLGLFSKKLNAAQRKYPTTDKGLLAMGKGCQHFDTIIRGGEIVIHCDHKNLTFGNETRHTSQRVSIAQIRIKCDYGADIVCASGEDNTGGDEMS